MASSVCCWFKTIKGLAYAGLTSSFSFQLHDANAILLVGQFSVFTFKRAVRNADRFETRK